MAHIARFRAGIAIILVALLALSIASSPNQSAATEPALVPTLSSTSPRADGFTFAISNYNYQFSWQLSATAGSAILQGGIVTVSGLNPGQSATITVTASRTGYQTGSTTIISSAPFIVNPAPTPTPLQSANPTTSPNPIATLISAPRASFTSVTPTNDGFTAVIANYDSTFAWSATVTVGKVSLKGSLITVTELSPGQSSRVSVISSRIGYVSSTNTFTSSARAGIQIAPTPSSAPSFAQPDNPTTTSPMPSASTSPTPSKSTVAPTKPTATPIPSKSPSASANPSKSATDNASPTPAATVEDKASAASIGKPITSPKAPLRKGSKVLVPILANAEIPETTAKPTSKITFLTLGGISKSKISDLPFVKINPTSKSQIEVQVLKGIPTSITITDLPKNAKASARFIAPSGKTVTQSNLLVSKSGTITLTPITITAASKTLEVAIKVGKKTERFRVRN